MQPKKYILASALHYVLKNFSDDIFCLYLQIIPDFYRQSVPVWIITFLSSNRKNAWKINIKSYTNCQISNVNLTQIWMVKTLPSIHERHDDYYFFLHDWQEKTWPCWW
jgi:hypothetical protein